MIDGDLATFACLLDETRNPNGNPNALPVGGQSPVLVITVFDLGEARTTSGTCLVTHRYSSFRSPQSVRVFTCDDLYGKVNPKLIAQKTDFLPTAFSNSLFLTWEPVNSRYIAVVVDDSWEKAHHDSLRTEPDLGFCLKGTKYQDEPYGNSGWWTGMWGSMQDAKGPEPTRPIPGLAEDESPEKLPWATVAGTPLDKRSSGRGDKFLVSLAEVKFFDQTPADFTAPNPPEVAVNPGRLLRDWLLQDCGLDVTRCFTSKKSNGVEKAMVQKALAELDPAKYPALRDRLTALESVSGSDPRWIQLYTEVCTLRRAQRLQQIAAKVPVIVYVKHHVLGGWTAYHWTEHLTDGLNDFRTLEARGGSQLCVLKINPDGSTVHEVLLDKPEGVIRNPNFSVDGKWLVFSMRENLKTDDFKLYVMNFETRELKRVTSNPVVNGKELICADIEPTFTPEGKIIFNSTRCSQQDDCWVGACANLFMCDADGSRFHRIGFDQVHTFYPQMLPDGKILYTRWEYSDRTVFFIQALASMNSNGTAQTEYYGNQSWFPTSILHGRPVPGTNKVIAILAGHHTQQRGQLVLIDRSKGTQGDAGIEFVAGAKPDEVMRLKPGKTLENAKPGDFDVLLTLGDSNVSPTGRQQSDVMPGNIYQPNFYSSLDQWGQSGPQFMFPFALDEKNYLVSYLPEGCTIYKGPFNPGFGLYYMTDSGRRELLAFDWLISCTQSVVRPQAGAAIEPQVVKPAEDEDYTKGFGQYYVQNVYIGPAVKDVPPGTVKTLRVVGLEYRVAHVGSNRSQGLSGNTPMHTVVANRGGTWDLKHVLGEVDVEEDGSAFFEVPANTPVYFQLLDENGRLVQTMRSWSTLRPGETFACVGCHEDKTQVITSAGAGASIGTLAMKKPVQKLRPIPGTAPHPLLARLEKGGLAGSPENYWTINQPRPIQANGPTEGFSYRQNIQPIWDRHCVVCHTGDTQNADPKKASALALTSGVVYVDNPQEHEYYHMKRAFTRSYIALTEEATRVSTIDEVNAFRQRTGRWPYVCWPHALGPASPVPPYSCGSNRSRLMECLEPSHYGV